MKKIHPFLPLGTICVLVVLSLVTGCYRPASPDLTPTPGTPNMMGTAAVHSADATQAAQATTGEESPVETPTTPPPTATPVPTQTPVPPTAVPATSVPTAVSPTATPSPTGQVTHVVQRGENLFRIALRYGTTVQAIASANGIANPALIYVGQKLTIYSSGVQPPAPAPSGTTYVVQPGDNLFRIALRYNLNYIYLAQYNGIANPSHVYVGQVIRIPPR
jgi:LysM repeat protein